jgi:exopolysaccharide production protein ExoY
MSDAGAYTGHDFAAQRSAGEEPPEARPVFRPVYPTVGKRLLDLLLLMLVAPAVLPLVVLLVVVIRVADGPALFAQDRLGRHGRVFRFWKLRTMVVDAEQTLERYLADHPDARAEWDTYQKLSHDPRITPVGHFLRKTSLDEIPQLWNVLRGDMSLVGPRPMLPQQQPLYPGVAYSTLRPGLTGSWQVGQRHTSTFADRARYDDQYAAELSLWTDLRLMAATVRVVLQSRGR